MFRHEKSEISTKHGGDGVLQEGEGEVRGQEQEQGRGERGVPGEGGCGLDEGGLRVKKKARMLSGAGGGERGEGGGRLRCMQRYSGSMGGSRGNGASP
jgi:hypothetical protein